MSMTIKETTIQEIEIFSCVKPDLLDRHAVYFGAYIQEELAGIVAYVEHDTYIYFCHDYVLEKHRNKGVYKLLSDYRDMKLRTTTKSIIAHANTNSIKMFLDKGYKIDKPLFKIIKS